MSVPRHRVLSARERELLGRSTSTAHGLPARVYFDPEIFALERDTIFARRWVALAHAADVPEVGDVWPINFAGRDVVVVRGDDGRIRCFYNVCRHRGMTLVGEPCRV